MKYARILLAAAVCGVLFSLAGAASAQTDKQGVATIVRIQGEARYSLGDGNWHPLVVGKVLAAGSVIQTAHNTYVDMVLGKAVEMPQASPVPDRIAPAPDSFVRGLVDYKPSVEQNMVRMIADTTLAIDTLMVSDTGLDSVSDTELDLQKGRIYCAVKKLSSGSKYFVKIPNGIAGVRGTFFFVDAKGPCGAYQNSVYYSITKPDGTTVTVDITEGNMFDPSTGQSMPLPPDVLNLFAQLYPFLHTPFVQIFSFEFDRTWCHISPTSGNPHGPPHDGHGGH